MTRYFHEQFESTDYRDRFTSGWRLGHHDQPATTASRSGDKGLHIPIDTGNHYGMDAGLDLADADIADDPPRELYSSYWIKFGDGFTHSHGFASKLPGFQNHERRPSGAAGTPSDGTNGWAARGMFADGGSGAVEIGWYCYHMDMSGSYGDKLEATTLDTGEWHHIEQRLTLNTVSNGDPNRDGVMSLWVDGDRVHHDDSMAFTLYPDNGVNYAFMVYYGGSEPSPRDNDVYLDDWVLDTERVGHPGPRSGVEDADVFVLSAGDTADAESYEFTVEGSVQKRYHPTEEAAEDYNQENDGITDNGDGTVTVTGMSSGGHADSYYVDGEVTEVRLDADLWTLYYGGEETTLADLGGTDTGAGDSGSGNGSAGDGSDTDDSADDETPDSGTPDSGTGDSDNSGGGTDTEATVLDVADGSDITPHLTQIGDGDHVALPDGKFTVMDVTIDADDWTLDGQGATVTPIPNATIRPEGQGWTLENIRFDVDSGNVKMFPRGGDWTLRGLAWDGPNSLGSPLIRPYVDAGTTANIDRCWFGGGMGTRVGESAVKANYNPNRDLASVRGELTLSRSYFKENATYVSPSAAAQDGVVHVDSCYYENPYLAGVRAGGQAATATVSNTVITVENPDAIPETASGQSASRGVWAYYEDVDVVDSHIHMPGRSAFLTGKGGSMTVRGGAFTGRVGGDVTVNDDVGSDPKQSPPEECVQSVADAVGGGYGDGDYGDGGYGDGTDEDEDEDESSGLGRTIRIEGDNEAASYEFTVEGEVEADTSGRATFDPEDEIGDTVSGTVHGGVDAYTFEGEITDFEHEGAFTLLVDGEEVDPASLRTREVVVRSPPRGSAGRTRYYYYFECDEVVETENIEDHEEFIEDWHDGRTFVHGELYRGGFEDKFVLRGEVAGAGFHDDLTLLVDGEAVDSL